MSIKCSAGMTLPAALPSTVLLRALAIRSTCCPAAVARRGRSGARSSLGLQHRPRVGNRPRRMRAKSSDSGRSLFRPAVGPSAATARSAGWRWRWRWRCRCCFGRCGGGGAAAEDDAALPGHEPADDPGAVDVYTVTRPRASADSAPEEPPSPPPPAAPLPCWPPSGRRREAWGRVPGERRRTEASRRAVRRLSLLRRGMSWPRSRPQRQLFRRAVHCQCAVRWCPRRRHARQLVNSP